MLFIKGTLLAKDLKALLLKKAYMLWLSVRNTLRLISRSVPMPRSFLHASIPASHLAAVVVAWSVGIEVPPGPLAGIAPK